MKIKSDNINDDDLPFEEVLKTLRAAKGSEESAEFLSKTAFHGDLVVRFFWNNDNNLSYQVEGDDVTHRLLLCLLPK